MAKFKLFFLLLIASNLYILSGSTQIPPKTTPYWDQDWNQLMTGEGQGINLQDYKDVGSIYTILSFAKDNLARINPFKRLNLTGANLSGLDLADIDLSHANFTRANLTNANLERATLAGANFSDADLSHANLSQAYLPLAKFPRANLTDATLDDVRADGADFSNAKLINTQFILAKLNGAYLNHANLTNANFRLAKLENAYMNDAITNNTYLGGVNTEKIKSLPPAREMAKAQNVPTWQLPFYYRWQMDYWTYIHPKLLAWKKQLAQKIDDMKNKK